MKSLLTFNVSVLCTEEEAERLKADPKVDPTDLTSNHVFTKLADEELLEDDIDAVELLTDRYKDIGV